METSKATVLAQASKPVTGVPAGMEDSDELVPSDSEMDDEEDDDDVYPFIIDFTKYINLKNIIRKSLTVGII